MKNENYYIGLDIGTDSVGYAVTDERYTLCKYKGDAMWGVTLFDEVAEDACKTRRGYRTARRRLARRQARVRLVQELFAAEVAKVDPDLYRRIKESDTYAELPEDKVRLFGSREAQMAYQKEYPTIHHLIKALMSDEAPHDVRLVYLACAWLVAHRGHFLNDVDRDNLEAVTDFDQVFHDLEKFLQVDRETGEVCCLPWEDTIGRDKVKDTLSKKVGITKKKKALEEALFGEGGKAPTKLRDEASGTDGWTYNYADLITLLAGGSLNLKDKRHPLFGKEEYAELENTSLSLHMEDDTFAELCGSIDEDDAELLIKLKAVYDWSILSEIMRGETYISDAKVKDYEDHKNDLQLLKDLIKKYGTRAQYDDLFRKTDKANNYVAYVGRSSKSASQEELCKEILKIVKNFRLTEDEQKKHEKMLERLEVGSFLPKQVNGDNRTIPYQVYYAEMKKILKQAEQYLPFLSERDEYGSVSEKLLKIMEFRVPYYVGPLQEKRGENDKLNHWMVRKGEQRGRIYPWNFDDIVDLDQSEQAFISRMTNSCIYCLGEDVLPKNSLLYSSFEVLNEINCLKINGNQISVKVKQEIYENLFMKYDKVTPNRIKDYLCTNHYMKNDDVLSGIDETVKSSLKPYRKLHGSLTSGRLSDVDAERIIERLAYSEDRGRVRKWIKAEYPHLNEKETNYLSNLPFKGFGRLSKKFLAGIKGTSEKNTIIRALWETNCNLMQLLSDRFTFKEALERENSAYCREQYGSIDKHSKEHIEMRMDEMRLSGAVKRSVYRTLDILDDVVKVQKHAPNMIFVEMANGGGEKGKRTKSRKQNLLELYQKVKDEDVRLLDQQLKALGEDADNKLQSDKLFLYFTQLGRCLYTGRSISLESILSGDGAYNIEHIYPRAVVKDDSVLNNKILVDSKANGDKSDTYPVSAQIRATQWSFWNKLLANNLITQEKYNRLVRDTPFSADERFGFANRQLVETRQSTKAVVSLLRELYPDSEIVCVKAALASEFRQAFKCLKSRAVNDLHHAKDAYLNVVVGNVWYHKFSKNFWREDAENNIKAEKLYTHDVMNRGNKIWDGATDKDRVVEILHKNTPHMTKFAFCRHGGLFDQQPVSAAEGLVPRKKGKPTEIYGGYNKPTASFFVLVRFQKGKTREVMVMPVELLYADRFLSDAAFAEEYAKKTVSSIVNKPVTAVEFLLNGRILKVNTMLSLDGLRVCIAGKSSGGSKIIAQNLTVYKTTVYWEKYIKHLESFDQKRKKNPNLVYSKEHDEIDQEQNLELFDLYVVKLGQKPFSLRPANPIETLKKGRSLFAELSVPEQVRILLGIQGLFVRQTNADLSLIKGAPHSGVSAISSSVSNWKKNYSDVRIIDTSASGLFESQSCNLLELL